MNWIENVLIIGGISLDIFAAMEIEGAMLAEVKKKSLAIACALVTILQLGFFFGGYGICYQLSKHELLQHADWLGYTIATIVLAFLGIRLIIKAIRREFVNESRGEIKVSNYIRIIAVASLYTLMAGCSYGLIGTNVLGIFCIIIICSLLVVVGGLYTGYHFGFEKKTWAYVIGAVLLWIAAGEVFYARVFPYIG